MGKYAPIIQVAECGSLTKAAQILGYTQSSLSYITSNIEKELGTKIFRRSRQGVTLTDAGRDLFTVMTQIEKLERDLYYIAMTHRASVLRIGSVTSTSAEWLPEILRIFYEAFPETVVYIVQTNQYIDLTTGLQNNTIDCGFSTGHHRSHFDFSPVYEDEYFVVVNRNHPLASKTEIRVEELYQHDFIFPSEGAAPGPLTDLCQELKVTCKLFTQSSEDSLTVKLVEMGLGFSILPGLLLEVLTRGKQLVAIPFAEKRHRTMGILSRPYEEINDATRAFIRLSQKFIKAWEPVGHWRNMHDTRDGQ